MMDRLSVAGDTHEQYKQSAKQDIPHLVWSPRTGEYNFIPRFGQRFTGVYITVDIAEWSNRSQIVIGSVQ